MRKVKNKPNRYAECKGYCYGKEVTYRCYASKNKLEKRRLYFKAMKIDEQTNQPTN